MFSLYSVTVATLCLISSGSRMPLAPTKAGGIEICTPPMPIEQKCKSGRKKWYFNKGKCQKFVYCGGKGNGFVFKNACEDKCKVKKPIKGCSEEIEGVPSKLQMEVKTEYRVFRNVECPEGFRKVSNCDKLVDKKNMCKQPAGKFECKNGKWEQEGNIGCVVEMGTPFSKDCNCSKTRLTKEFTTDTPTQCKNACEKTESCKAYGWWTVEKRGFCALWAKPCTETCPRQNRTNTKGGWFNYVYHIEDGEQSANATRQAELQAKYAARQAMHNNARFARRQATLKFKLNRLQAKIKARYASQANRNASFNKLQAERQDEHDARNARFNKSQAALKARYVTYVEDAKLQAERQAALKARSAARSTAADPVSETGLKSPKNMLQKETGSNAEKGAHRLLTPWQVASAIWGKMQ